MEKGSEADTHARVQPMSAACATLSDTLLTVITREYGGARHAAKRLAQHAKTSHRTAEKWLLGTSVPSGENLLNLLAECDALAAEVNRLVEERRANRK